MLPSRSKYFLLPNQLNCGEFPQNTHFPKSSILILYSRGPDINKIHLHTNILITNYDIIVLDLFV